MTKQEFIQHAYGTHDVSKLADSNGWITRKVIGHGLTNNMEYENFGFDTSDIDFRDIDAAGYYVWRPKGLRGVEDNNGWIKIESLADLPTGDRLLYNVFGKVTETVNFQASRVGLKTLIRDFHQGFITHYKVVVKDEPVY